MIKKETNEKLHQAVLEAIELDDARLDAELQNIPKHQFSEKFERQMNELLCKYRKKKMRKKIIRHVAAAAAVVVCITGGLALSSFNNAQASKPGLNIAAWLKAHFGFTQSSDSWQEVPFDTRQFSYVPEGFILREAEISASSVKYKYKNDQDDYFTLKISNMDASWQQHNKNIDMENGLNSLGFEYTYIYEKDQGIHVFMWEASDSLFYDLRGNISKETMTDIMNGIQYER